MSISRSQHPIIRNSTIVWLSIAVAAFAGAAFIASAGSLLLLLLADAAGIVALGHLLRLRNGASVRDDLGSAGTYLTMLTAYIAFAAALIGNPLRWLRNGASLSATLTISAAVVLTMLALWRLWPAFGFVCIRAWRRPNRGTRSSLLADSIAHAWRLTAENEVFFGHGLIATLSLLLLAQGALSLAGLDAPIAAPYRLPALMAYALLTPIAHWLVLRNSARVLLLNGRRARGERAAAADAAKAIITREIAPPTLPDELDPADVNAMLLRCVRSGQTQLALAALAHGADPNAVPPPDDRDQRSPLVLAVLNPDLRLLRGFIARGAELQRVHAGLPPLIAATRDSSEGRAEAVMTLLTNGASVQCADAQGNTPLHFAVLSARPIVAALLCDAGARLDAINADGQTPLAVACEAANWELVQFLLERGAKPEVGQAQPAIIAAASIAEDDAQGVKLLLKRRIRVDARDALERTALMTAALHGHVAIAQTLLNAGAQIDAADAHGTTALIEAARAGAHEVLDALIEHHPAPDRADHAGRTALIVASQSARADEETVRRLLALGVSRQLAATDGRRAVECAAAAGRWNIVALLDPNYPRPATLDAAKTIVAADSTNSPEHLLDALRFGHWHIVENFDERARTWPQAERARLFLELSNSADSAARQWLLNRGLNANAALADGASLLQTSLARIPASLSAVKQLLDAGAQVSGGDTLLRLCAACTATDAPRAELEKLALRLLESGADGFAADAQGRTSLALAVTAGRVELCAALLARGVDPQTRDRNGRTPLFAALAAPPEAVEPLIKSLLRAGADPEVRAANNETPLGLALARSHVQAQRWLNWPDWKLPRRALRGADLVASAGRGDQDAVDKLLALGLAVDALDEFGATALLHAAGQGHAALTEFLLERGADPQHAARTGATALSAAVSAGRKNIVELLLDRGIAVDQSASGGSTCLMLAAARGAADFVDLLLQRGAQANAVDAHGACALHAAARFAFAGSDSAPVRRVCEALFAAGAAVDARNHDGQTALLLLLGAHAPPRAAANQRALLEVLELLRVHGAGLDAQDDRGVGPLHACAMHGLLLPLRALLAAGADPSRCDLLGRTPREVAHLLGFIDVAAELAAGRDRRRAL